MRVLEMSTYCKSKQRIKKALNVTIKEDRNKTDCLIPIKRYKNIKRLKRVIWTISVSYWNL